MTTDILTMLREQTAPYHVQIENNPYARSVTNGSLTWSKYTNYLEKFYGYYVPLEKVFSERTEWVELGFDYRSRIKSSLLMEDLLQLGLTQAQLATIPLCTRLPDLSNFPRILGCMYVLEGSTLGGQLVVKLIKQSLPVDVETNCRFFNSYGASVRDKWNEFRELLLASASSEQIEQDMIAAARDTFITLNQWMEQ